MKKFTIVISVMIMYFLFAAFTYAPTRSEQQQDDLNKNIEDIVDGIDLSELEAYVASLSEQQQSLLGTNGIKERLKAVITGNLSTDYKSFVAYIASVLGVNILNYLPIITAIIAIAVAFNLLNSLRGRFASESVQNIVYFACAALLTALLFSQIFAMVNAVKNIVSSLQRQMRIVFPLLMTLMAAVGANSSVAVYKPAIAVLAGGITELVTVFILPAFIVSIVLTAIGNLSSGVRLNKLSDFFSSASKWLLGTSFFLFTAFLAVQGITASVYDGVSVRAAKFALSKYVPIIGGYLSDGLNLVMSGSVLVKNAIGTTAILILFASVIPIIVQILMLSLSLHFAGAIIEPLGDERMSSLVSGLGKNVTVLISIVLAVSFLYFIFLILIVCTGNLAL